MLENATLIILINATLINFNATLLLLKCSLNFSFDQSLLVTLCQKKVLSSLLSFSICVFLFFKYYASNTSCQRGDKFISSNYMGEKSCDVSLTYNYLSNCLFLFSSFTQNKTKITSSFHIFFDYYMRFTLTFFSFSTEQNNSIIQLKCNPMIICVSLFQLSLDGMQ